MKAKKISVTSVKEILQAKGFSGGSILFDGRRLGSFVTHGHKSGNGNTVYASRIFKPCRIQVEGATKRSMLNKVASALARRINEDGLDISEIGMPME